MTEVLAQGIGSLRELPFLVDWLFVSGVMGFLSVTTEARCKNVTFETQFQEGHADYTSEDSQLLVKVSKKVV